MGRVTWKSRRPPRWWGSWGSFAESRRKMRDLKTYPVGCLRTEVQYTNDMYRHRWRMDTGEFHACLQTLQYTTRTHTQMYVLVSYIIYIYVHMHICCTTCSKRRCIGACVCGCPQLWTQIWFSAIKMSFLFRSGWSLNLAQVGSH